MALFQMHYVPENELSVGFNLLEPGPGTFIVKNIFHTDKEGFPLMTKDGQPKIIVVVDVTDVNGDMSSVYEHITAKAVFKAATMCKAVGRKELYTEQGTDFDALKGLSGKCILKNDNTPGMNPSTKVGSYVAHEKYKGELPGNVVAVNNKPMHEPIETKPFVEDDLPF